MAMESSINCIVAPTALTVRTDQRQRLTASMTALVSVMSMMAAWAGHILVSPMVPARARAFSRTSHCSQAHLQATS